MTHGIVGVMAAVPWRENVLPQVLSAIVPQVDHLYLHLNLFDNIPACIKDLPKTTYVLDKIGKYNDTVKFMWMDHIGDYLFTFDDDWIYPPNYVQRLIMFSKSLGDKAIVGVHGKVFRPPYNSSSCIKLTGLTKALEKPMRVHYMGTGTLASHRSLINVPIKSVLEWNAQTDFMIADYARKRNIEMWIIDRKKDWIQVPRGFDGTESKFLYQAPEKLKIMERLAPWPQLSQ